MAAKSFQFRLASLVWLVVGSAMAFGIIRSANSGGPGRIQWQVRDNISRVLKSLGVASRVSDEVAVAIIVLPFMYLPVLFLFFHRRLAAPRRTRGARHAASAIDHPPSAPLQERLTQFISNVAYIEPPAEPAESSVVLPASLDGKPARTRDEMCEQLGRIREAVAESSNHDAK